MMILKEVKLIPFLATTVSPCLSVATIAVAVATKTQDGGFFFAHPDAASWIMVSLVSLTCLMGIYIGSGVVSQLKEIKVQTASLSLKVTQLEQHCKDTGDFGGCSG